MWRPSQQGDPVSKEAQQGGRGAERRGGHGGRAAGKGGEEHGGAGALCSARQHGTGRGSQSARAEHLRPPHPPHESSPLLPSAGAGLAAPPSHCGRARAGHGERVFALPSRGAGAWRRCAPPPPLLGEKSACKLSGVGQ